MLCPCHSKKRYADCCKPFHSGAREAPTPEALMRSRYSAFARGDGTYLALTLAKSHPDASVPKHELIEQLSRVLRKFAGLRIIHAATHGDTGEVLFHAKLYDRGADASFAELSQFVREGEAWRYASGEIGEIDELLRRVRPA